MSKITIAVAAAAGYLLGMRAGRERYDVIVRRAENLWNKPRVQEVKQRTQKKAEARTAELISDDIASRQGPETHGGSGSTSELNSLPERLHVGTQLTSATPDFDADPRRAKGSPHTV